MLVCTHVRDGPALLSVFTLSLSLSLIPSLIFLHPSFPTHPSIHPSILPTPSEHRISPLCCFLLICVPHRRCSLLSHITSDHPPAPSVSAVGALSPTACSWASTGAFPPPDSPPAADHVWVSAWNIQSQLDTFLQCRSGWVSVFLVCMEPHNLITVSILLES